ncbi:MAG TPA: peptidoglycan-binding domain-containing protein [Candidatus Sulfotelmatobacter sp.]|nr:peptidoglycan-binding domain-containing protein [Candidatus Sulfotelmatobacter sp.]
MLKFWFPVRKVGLGVIPALVLACLVIPTANAGQSSGTDSTPKKTTTKTSTAASKSKKTTTARHHKSQSSATSKSASSHTASRKRSSRKKTSKVRGQQKIDSERAQQIQEALIREHYLTGDATGSWNQASEEAMRRYQADHGWQSKTVPDSRALISLGLGPSKDHLLNPESAMTTTPPAPKSQSVPTTSQSSPATADPVAPTATTPTPASGNAASGDPAGPQ